MYVAYNVVQYLKTYNTLCKRYENMINLFDEIFHKITNEHLDRNNKSFIINFILECKLNMLNYKYLILQMINNIHEYSYVCNTITFDMNVPSIALLYSYSSVFYIIKKQHKDMDIDDNVAVHIIKNSDGKYEIKMQQFYKLAIQKINAVCCVS